MIMTRAVMSICVQPMCMEYLTVMSISHAVLSFFAISLNLCLCLKRSPLTVDHLKIVAARSTQWRKKIKRISFLLK